MKEDGNLQHHPPDHLQHPQPRALGVVGAAGLRTRRRCFRAGNVRRFLQAQVRKTVVGVDVVDGKVNGLC